MIISVVSEKTVDKIQQTFMIKNKIITKRKNTTPKIKGNLFNMINGIHENTTTKIKLSSERLKVLSLRSGAKQDDCFHHCYSISYWEFWTRKLDKKKQIKGIQLDHKKSN